MGTPLGRCDQDEVDLNADFFFFLCKRSRESINYLSILQKQAADIQPLGRFQCHSTLHVGPAETADYNKLNYLTGTVGTGDLGAGEVTSHFKSQRS